jgi:hypothetical protein
MTHMTERHNRHHGPPEQIGAYVPDAQPWLPPAPGSSISQRFNALNVNLWRQADSADLADEETGERLLNGVQRSRRSRCVSFAKVRVAGSNPVVRSE